MPLPSTSPFALPIRPSSVLKTRTPLRKLPHILPSPSFEKRNKPLCWISTGPSFGSVTRHSTGSPVFSASTKRCSSVFGPETKV